MKKLFLWLLAGAFSVTLPAQTITVTGNAQGPDYFPAELMQQEAVRGVTVYETEIEDPQEQTVVSNRIRLARKLIFDSYFNAKGQKTRTIYYQSGSNEMRDHLTFSYTRSGLPRKTTYVYPQPGSVLPTPNNENSPENVIVHRRETENFYGEDGKLAYRTVVMMNTDTTQLTDSLRYAYDITGRLKGEKRYIMGEANATSVEREFKHGQRSLTIYTANQGKLLSREINRYDLEGRLASQEFFAQQSPTPRYREQYHYNTQGKVASITYIYDWAHYKKEESVINRKNIFDDQGKLLEVQLEYADGKRLVKFYDYTYFTDSE